MHFCSSELSANNCLFLYTVHFAGRGVSDSCISVHREWHEACRRSAVNYWERCKWLWAPAGEGSRLCCPDCRTFHNVPGRMGRVLQPAGVPCRHGPGISLYDCPGIRLYHYRLCIHSGAEWLCAKPPHGCLSSHWNHGNSSFHLASAQVWPHSHGPYFWSCSVCVSDLVCRLCIYAWKSNGFDCFPICRHQCQAVWKWAVAYYSISRTWNDFRNWNAQLVKRVYCSC